MKKASILVVEDEKDVKDLILLHLRREGHEPVAMENGEDALKAFQEKSFDLAILDWMLPGMSGLELCKRMAGRLPILMVTARADSADIVLGLEMGADDYVTKPFEIPVLLARVRALLRRSGGERTEATRFQVGGLSLDIEKHEVLCGNESVPLTASEFKLLTALLRHQGRVLSRDKLIEQVQGEGVFVTDRAVDTHVFGLRKKLGGYGDFIETIRGVGYRVKAE